MAQARRLVCRLSERKSESLRAWIQKFDRECMARHGTLLTDELIQTIAGDDAGSIRARVDAVMAAWAGAIDRDLKPDRFAFLNIAMGAVRLSFNG